MRVESETPRILLPKGWQGCVKSAVVQVISLDHYTTPKSLTNVHMRHTIVSYERFSGNDC